MDVWFLGDFQWAGKKANSTALTHLQRTIGEALEDGDKAGREVRFIGMGDYIDFASPSNRARLKAANLYDTAMDVVDEKALELTLEIYELALKPTKGRWLGLVEGHHFHEMKDGTTTDMRLCALLDAPFLGTSGLIKVGFNLGRDSLKRGLPVTLWVHHGVGSGQTGYFPLARLEKIAAVWEQVDVFAMGHTTKMCHEFMNKPYPRWSPAMDLAHRKVILMGTGGYSKTYVEGAMQGRIPRGGYAEQRMLSASIIGSPVLHIHPRVREGYVSLDLTAEG